MYKVMIVDDEPFIAMGMSKLIAWEEEGYEIVYTANNGKDALDYFLANQVDLIIADIQMPVMNGLELLENVRKVNKDTFFVILSGFDKFGYVQNALRNNCTDYILKPVQKDELLGIIRKIKKEHQEQKEQHGAAEDKKYNQELENTYIEHNLRAILNGKYNDTIMNQVESMIPILVEASEYRYINIYPFDIGKLKDLDDEEVREYMSTVYDICKQYLKDYSKCIINDYSSNDDEYNVGFVWCDKMRLRNEDINHGILDDIKRTISEKTSIPVVMIAGKKVDALSKLYRSYSTVYSMRSFISFCDEKSIYIYEDEVINNESEGMIICTESLENLVKAISLNDKDKINDNVNLFFAELEKTGYSNKSMTINMNYLMYRLIYLAIEQDETVNQEEVMQYISENTLGEGVNRGGKTHFLNFANEYAEYIIQLSKNVSRGVLADIEKEIHDNYGSNLTLRELSKKYFINSSYLGQIFRKKYGVSFKDYLCEYRIDKAAYELLHSEKKIGTIAEEVGYKDLDYFVSKFAEKKGCPPAKYRRGLEKNN